VHAELHAVVEPVAVRVGAQRVRPGLEHLLAVREAVAVRVERARIRPALGLGGVGEPVPVAVLVVARIERVSAERYLRPVRRAAAVAVLRRGVRAAVELGGVRQAVAVRVWPQRVRAVPPDLLAVRQPVPIRVGRGRIGPAARLVGVAQAVAVRVHGRALGGAAGRAKGQRGEEHERAGTPHGHRHLHPGADGRSRTGRYDVGNRRRTDGAGRPSIGTWVRRGHHTNLAVGAQYRELVTASVKCCQAGCCERTGGSVPSEPEKRIGLTNRILP